MCKQLDYLTCRYHGAVWCALVADGWITLEVSGDWARMARAIYQ
jgi:hypothetical protein